MMDHGARDLTAMAKYSANFAVFLDKKINTCNALFCIFPYYLHSYFNKLHSATFNSSCD